MELSIIRNCPRENITEDGKLVICAKMRNSAVALKSENLIIATFALIMTLILQLY